MVHPGKAGRLSARLRSDRKKQPDIFYGKGCKDGQYRKGIQVALTNGRAIDEPCAERQE